MSIRSSVAPVVDTNWVADHIAHPNVRLIECDVCRESYDFGHIPGAVFWHAHKDLVDGIGKLDRSERLRVLLQAAGVSNSTTVVCYGGHAAVGAWLFWLLRLHGHKDVRILDGGRGKWIREGRPIESTETIHVPASYATKLTAAIRASTDDVVTALTRPDENVIIDVRTRQEFSGEWFMESAPKAGERAGHIPGAIHIPYQETVTADGCLKSREELAACFAARGVTPDKEVITYCAVGGRSAHTWFVLRHLLHFPRVKNYEGSWADWSARNDLPVIRADTLDDQRG